LPKLTCLCADFCETYFDKFPNLKWKHSDEISDFSSFRYDKEPRTTIEYCLRLTHIYVSFYEKEQDRLIYFLSNSCPNLVVMEYMPFDYWSKDALCALLQKCRNLTEIREECGM